MSEYSNGLSPYATVMKRIFDVSLAFIGITLFWWLIIIAAVLARLDTGQSGFFKQSRVGQFGKLFNVVKIRTMRPVKNYQTTVTTKDDVRITPLGRFFRKTKIDELPQLFNVLLGQMSFVGPRPDVPGFADKLKGSDRLILSIRPGITGPATLKYRNEEQLLAKQDDPEKYNEEVIYPDKVAINIEYILNYSVIADLKYIYKTLVS